jgi:uncharacterized protein YwgA
MINGRMTGSVLRGVISLVDAMGGSLDQRIRLQKAAYLLQRRGVEDFRPASFKYHHYGPYSRGLSDAIQAAVSLGLLEEEKIERADSDAVSYRYVLTDLGRTWLKENSGSPDAEMHRHAEALKGAPWRALELAATALFLERDERLPARAVAMRRAIELKPACEAYQAQAADILAALSL